MSKNSNKAAETPQSRRPFTLPVRLFPRGIAACPDIGSATIIDANHVEVCRFRKREFELPQQFEDRIQFVVDAINNRIEGMKLLQNFKIKEEVVVIQGYRYMIDAASAGGMQVPLIPLNGGPRTIALWDTMMKVEAL